MELKEYQQKTLDQVKRYLEALDTWHTKNKRVIEEIGPEMAIDVPQKAWQEVIGSAYHPRKNGLNEDLPNFCLKIPTGGGKTFLAVKTIDLINQVYRKKRTGLVLWVVPSNQIYRQTIQNLRNREHPYRQHLDIASGGKTLILEKMDHFSPLDLEENLAVLMLMLPSAARQNKETLKVFKDRGGFSGFFPAEDDIQGQRNLLAKYPNLDVFGDDNGFYGRQVKTSLGNVLRIVSPIIILDEGHKAYSANAQNTLRGFNPSIIVELSATPTSQSNVLVDIKGTELNREGMIKLDLHITNKASVDWTDTLLASVEKRNYLEEQAKQYEGNTGIHIRPICLVQVERTGRDQRSTQYIHAEDVREWLTKTIGIPEEQVAVKTSEKDDIEGINLLARDCQIRYIITKQALQEGWDCPFAYVLTVLTNPSSQTALTQLVGRILRQPYAMKTNNKELDESYVFVFQQRGARLLSEIRMGFEQEGLGDLAGQIVADETSNGEFIEAKEKTVELRDKYKKFAGKIYLPLFVVQDGQNWRHVSYDMDILSRINWSKVDLSPLFNLKLSDIEDKDIEVAIGLSEDEKQLIEQRSLTKLRNGGLDWDEVFIARHLMDIVPNPWIAYSIGKALFDNLVKSYPERTISNNLIFILEELKKYLIKESDRLAEIVFKDLIATDKIRFLVIRNGDGYRLPSTMKVKGTSKTLTRADNQPLQLNLFEFVPEEEFNAMERDVAWYLEDQSKLYWWYRNRSRQDYSIQGWRKHRIYPDFIMSEVDPNDAEDFDKVFVIETKGLHLKNEDTDYKKQVFALCNELAKTTSWNELGLELKETEVRYDVVFEDEWRRKINELFAN